MVSSSSFSSVDAGGIDIRPVQLHHKHTWCRALRARRPWPNADPLEQTLVWPPAHHAASQTDRGLPHPTRPLWHGHCEGASLRCWVGWWAGWPPSSYNAKWSFLVLNVGQLHDGQSPVAFVIVFPVVHNVWVLEAPSPRTFSFDRHSVPWWPEESTANWVWFHNLQTRNVIDHDQISSTIYLFRGVSLNFASLLKSSVAMLSLVSMEAFLAKIVVTFWLAEVARTIGRPEPELQALV